MRPLEICVVPAVVPAVQVSFRPRFPAACTTMLSDWVAVSDAEAESTARTVKLAVVSLPTAATVPEICPEVESIANPPGRAPAETLQVSGGTPPVEASVKL
jgi:hypothetical protein